MHTLLYGGGVALAVGAVLLVSFWDLLNGPGLALLFVGALVLGVVVHTTQWPYGR